MSETIEMLLVAGVAGDSIYLNDHRIAGPKPWGGGKIVQRWDRVAADRPVVASDWGDRETGLGSGRHPTTV